MISFCLFSVLLLPVIYHIHYLPNCLSCLPHSNNPIIPDCDPVLLPSISPAFLLVKPPDCASHTRRSVPHLSTYLFLHRVYTGPSSLLLCCVFLAIALQTSALICLCSCVLIFCLPYGFCCLCPYIWTLLCLIGFLLPVFDHAYCMLFLKC